MILFLVNIKRQYPAGNGIQTRTGHGSRISTWDPGLNMTDIELMQVAIEEARTALMEGEVPVGAVVAWAGK